MFASIRSDEHDYSANKFLFNFFKTKYKIPDQVRNDKFILDKYTNQIPKYSFRLENTPYKPPVCKNIVFVFFFPAKKFSLNA